MDKGQKTMLDWLDANIGKVRSIEQQRAIEISEDKQAKKRVLKLQSEARKRVKKDNTIFLHNRKLIDKEDLTPEIIEAEISFGEEFYINNK